MLLTLLLQGHPEPPSLNPIREHPWVFPWVETIHICGFAVLVGTAFILSMRMMNLMFPQRPVSALYRQLAPWIRAALICMLITGPYLMSSDPGEYMQVPAFRAKMLLLLLAILFHYIVVRYAAQAGKDAQPLAWRKLVGGMSLALWLSVVTAGLWIGNL